MTEKVKCEFFLAINAAGEFEACRDRDEAMYNVDGNCRVIKLTAFVTKPVDQSIIFDIPDTAGTTEQIEVEAA
jgi:hypothetical protein